MKTKLAKKPEIYNAMVPTWLPGCRRLTPGPGYLEALVEDNVNFITDSIVKITEEGILTAHGKERKVDAIVCATGFDTSHTPRYPTFGRNGITLAEQWKDEACAYMSLAAPNFPNLFIVAGPNSATGGGSLLIIFESIISYIVKCIQKLQREKLKSMEISLSAEKAWKDHCDAYFPGTVHASTC
jgi:cation diffusion facilitator CzcD-associated flavoprotein CzcO